MDFSRVFPQEYHKDLNKQLTKENSLVLSGIGNSTAKAFFISNFLQTDSNKIFWICQDQEEALLIYNNVKICLPSEAFLYLPQDNIQEKAYKYTHWITNEEQPLIYIISLAELQCQFPSLEILEQEVYNIHIDQSVSILDCMNTLIKNGYIHSKDTLLSPGSYRRSGDTIELCPIHNNIIYKIEIGFDVCTKILEYDPLTRKILQEHKKISIYPAQYKEKTRNILEAIPAHTTIVADEIDDSTQHFENFIENSQHHSITFTSFPKESQTFVHLRYLSVLKFYNLPDFLLDIKNKIKNEWEICIYSKRKNELENIFKEENISYATNTEEIFPIKIIDAQSDTYIPISFQNPDIKILFISDKEIFSLKKAQRNQTISKMNIDFITSLNISDYVVHFDHGIGVYMGITQRTVEKITREYLEIHFADNDMLFIPVDQADKVSKYITDGDKDVKLSKLGAKEWKKNITQAKKETQKLAKELLQLYAKRESARKDAFLTDNERETKFAKTFPYIETPGQLAAIMETKKDMESHKPMDRLICGDVGFGKTEVAMRAAFKAVENGKQVAIISPVTILAEQHYWSFKKRMESFGIKIEMLSRFRSEKEQTLILKGIKSGKLDIIIGTHRLIQKDIKFSNLGLLIIDEEQRFGVKQKEALKNMRTQVDILTLTATPIPRTLNLSLNKLRDITTITTPPPGRLPIMTEVRRYSDILIKEAIEKELERKGQTYFLHNRVETIEGIAEKLRLLVPSAKFIVAHGQMGSKMLEERIMAFKKGEYDVLISSTIIENGIDLPNANTMIINNAERFGLSQLYQLRGRIGRSSRQAYAYLLYHSQKLNLDAKKRLRALVEASELGTGFQIAMRDLEIRGAGEILGSSQHGSMKSVGVQHFLKLLHNTIEDIKNGKTIEDNEMPPVSNVTIELPIDAFIPNEYIHNSKEKIKVYQKIASVKSHSLLQEFYKDIIDEYGKMPEEVDNLFQILKLKLYAQKAYISKIHTRNLGNKGKEIHLTLNQNCKPEIIMKALEYNKKWLISGNVLKINIQDFGNFWFKELIKNIAAMSQ